MSSWSNNTASPADIVRKELQQMHQYWRWYLVMGIGMIALGTFAISWSCIASLTITAVWLFGFLLVASGVTEIINSFFSGRWSGAMLHLLIGFLYAIVGIMVIDQPAEAAVGLTLMISVFLIIGGVFRMVFAIAERFTGWMWVLINGAVSLLAGMIIYKQLPESALWVIGLFIGIDLIFNGWTWVMLAFGARNLPPTEAAPA